MLVQKFYAETSREALQLVRRALGSDALILSNRRAGRGVEIMAVRENEIDSVTAAVAPPRTVPGSHTPPRAEPRPAPGGSSTARPAALPPKLTQALPSYDLVHEVRVLRSLVEGQLAGFAFNDLKRRDAAKADVLRRLVAAGFGALLARELVAELPDGLDAVRGLRLTKNTLQRRLPVAAGAGTLVEQGGMFALVGPTGVGKTTTVAKLAAECALKRGAGSLALVTTDTYRIGAVDQLRIYGRILGRAGVRHPRRGRPACDALRAAHAPSRADRHGRHEPARPQAGRSGCAARGRWQPSAAHPAAVRGGAGECAGRRGARLPRRGAGRLHSHQGGRGPGAGQCAGRSWSATG